MSLLDLLAGAWTWFWRLITNAELANISSLVGVGLSVYVLWTVRDLKRRLIFNARLPKLREELQSNASAISLGLNDFLTQKPAIDQELTKCLSNLRSLEPKVKTNTKKAVVGLVVAIDRYLMDTAANHQTEDAVRAIYLRLNGVMQDLTNLSEDYKMEQS